MKEFFCLFKYLTHFHYNKEAVHEMYESKIFKILWSKGKAYEISSVKLKNKYTVSTAHIIQDQMGNYRIMNGYLIKMQS
jgi:hypothetical protein